MPTFQLFQSHSWIMGFGEARSIRILPAPLKRRMPSSASPQPYAPTDPNGATAKRKRHVPGSRSVKSDSVGLDVPVIPHRYCPKYPQITLAMCLTPLFR